MVELRRCLCGLDHVSVGQDHALGLAGRARGVEHHAGVVVTDRRLAVGLFLFEPLMRGATLGLDIGQRVQLGVVVFPQTARILVDDMRNVVILALRIEDALHFDHLVDLFLVATDGKLRAGMFQRIGHLFGDSVLVERHRDRADLHRGDHRPVHRRAVAPDNGNMVTFFDAKRQEPVGNGLDFLGRLGPAPGLPDSEFLFPVGGFASELGYVPCKQCRHGFGHARNRCHLSQYLSSLRRGARRRRSLGAGANPPLGSVGPIVDREFLPDFYPILTNCNNRARRTWPRPAKRVAETVEEISWHAQTPHRR